MRTYGICILALLMSVMYSPVDGAGIGTAFTYQGQVKRDGLPASGTCVIAFSLWNAPSDGSTVSQLITREDLEVVNGLFSTALDFGASAFDGEPRWLEIQVCCPSPCAPTTLSPRQRLTPVPYSSYAQTAGDAWSLQGNSGTVPGTHFLGTSDEQPLELHSANQRVLRLDGLDNNIIGGSSANTVIEGVLRSVINGGGSEDFPNTIYDELCTIGGGSGNLAGTNDGDTTSDMGATVSGGRFNLAGGGYSVVGGGDDNVVTGWTSVVAGGASNRAEGNNVVVAGGLRNSVYDDECTVGGGSFNTAGSDDGDFATAPYATVPGGRDNAADAAYSFAAGRRAKATHTGAFVWADSNDADFGSVGPDTFNIGAGGGVCVEARNSDAGAQFTNGTTGTGFDGDGIRAFASTSRGYNWAALYADNIGTSPAIYGISTDGPAAYLDGDVTVVGTLTKGGGAFKIDHPLDPENKYLFHSFVESADMMNIYNGNIVLDAEGEARVRLPAWFGALNSDFRYQLTCLGAFAPVYVAEEINDNQFQIAGGKPGMKVSWQVTGIRKDAWANANRIRVEVAKSRAERGKYLHSQAHGMPEVMDLKHELTHQKKYNSDERTEGNSAEESRSAVTRAEVNNAK